MPAELDHKQALATVSVPGRICLAGENADWMGGMAFAISLDDLRTRVTVCERATYSEVTFEDPYASESGQLKVRPDLFSPRDYCSAVVFELRQRYGLSHHYQIDVKSTLPSAGGCGSSAALCVGVAAAICALEEVHASSAEIAEIAYVAERSGCGVNCGRMDQYACALGGMVSFEFSREQCNYARQRTTDDLLAVLAWHVGEFEAFHPLGQRLHKEWNDGSAGLLDYLHECAAHCEQMRNLFERRNDMGSLQLLLDASRESIRRRLGVENDRLSALCTVAKSAGAFGARPTGARSAGGVMFAICHRKDARAVTRALAHHGAEVALTRIGGAGICIELPWAVASSSD